MEKTGKKKKATAETLATIVHDCDDVLAFLQAVAVKSPQVVSAALSLCADKHARVWFHQWSNINLPTSANTAPQYHAGLTGVLSDVATRFQT